MDALAIRRRSVLPITAPTMQAAFPVDDASPTLGLDVPTRLLGGEVVERASIAWAAGLDHVPGLRTFLAESHRRQTLAGRLFHGHPPICLVGPAGFGRGLLARRMSRLTGTPLVTYEASDLEAMIRRRETGGISAPVAALAMALTRCANPVIAIELPDGQIGPLAAQMLAEMLDPHRSGRWLDESLRTIFDLSAVSWVIQTPEVTPPVAAIMGASGAFLETQFQVGLLEDLRRLAIAVEVTDDIDGEDRSVVEAVFAAFRDDYRANERPSARLLVEHARRTCLRHGRRR